MAPRPWLNLSRAGAGVSCDSRPAGPCRCDRPAGVQRNLSLTRRHVWGLPSAGCAENWTHYWVHEYPRLHREWRAQGRVVVHCAPHAGLGNYLRALPSAIVYSAITAQALTLRCDDAQHGVWDARKAAERVVRVHEHLARFFHGAHFDWYFEANLPLNARTVELVHDQMAPGRWPYGNASANGTRVRTTFSIPPRRLLLFNQHTAWFRAAFPGEAGRAILSKELNLQGCFYRYLLAPTPALQRAVWETTGHAPVRRLPP